MPIFSLKCFRTDTQVARNRVRGFGLLKPHTVPARIVSPLSGAFSTLSAFQVESVEQPCHSWRSPCRATYRSPAKLAWRKSYLQNRGLGYKSQSLSY